MQYVTSLIRPASQTASQFRSTCMNEYWSSYLLLYEFGWDTSNKDRRSTHKQKDER